MTEAADESEGPDTNHDQPHNELTQWTASFILQGVLLLVVGAFGMVGNVSSIIHFSRDQRYTKKFYAFMLSLACIDIMVITLCTMMYALPEVSESYNSSVAKAYLMPWVVPFGQISLTGNIYFTIAITVERYFVICHPLRYQGHHSHRSPSIYILIILLFSIAYNFSRFFDLEAYTVTGNEEGVTKNNAFIYTLLDL